MSHLLKKLLCCSLVIVLVLCTELVGQESTRAPANSGEPDQAATPPQDSARTSKRIVLLYTHRVVSPVNSEWYRGIVSELKAAFTEPLDIEIEYLDLVRSNDEDFERSWIELLRAKYSRKRPDLVIPIYIGAITFLQEHREELFPGVPIVFCSATKNLADQMRTLPGTTGAIFEIDFNGTRELIKRLLPSTRNLVIITGASRESLDMRAAIGVGLLFSMYFSQAFEVEVWDGMPLGEMEEKISKLSPNTAVLLLSFDYDKLGNQYVTIEVAEQLAKKSSAPIFGIFDSLNGHGVVGGSMASVVGQGKLAGKLAAQVLRGAKPEELLPLGPEKPRLLFDDRQLRRFKIDSSLIPPSASIEFRPPSAWQLFGRYILWGAAALLAQSAIIISLLLNRRKRFAAEREARALAGKILTAQEEERSHLARELHDDLSQRLAAVAIEAGSLEIQTGDKSLPSGSLSKLRQGIISICDDLHRLSRRMHPSILDDFGLADALCADCTSLMQRSDIEVDCQIGKLPPKLPKPLELCLYRVAQESLWNAVRHSGASRITVRLDSDSKRIRLEIEDNGCGITLSDSPPSKGLGLASIKERIRLVSGSVEIQTQTDLGTKIAAVVPLGKF